MISEETLTLYYYDELPELEKQKVAQALADDDVLAARYATLNRELDAVDDFVGEVKPADHLVQQWHDTIDSAAQLERQRADAPRRGMHFSSFLWGAAAAAAIALVAISGGLFTEDAIVEPTTAPPMIVDNPGQPAAVPAAFTRGLQNHLQYSKLDLDSLASSEDQVMLIMQIIEQNRLFEQAAEQNNAARVARVLRAFEPILLRLANDDMAPEDAEALRERLSFELQVMLTKLEQQTSEDAETI